MNSTGSVILGAALAIIGGIIGDEFRAWRDRVGERKSICTSIADELQGMETTISSIQSVWDSAQIFPPSYVSELLSNTSSYDTLRNRLFLIKRKELRKEIGDFYKKLRDTARKTKGKIGTLAQTTEATNEQRGFVNEFQSLAGLAKTLREKLQP